ncbi:MAG: histidinol-phosphatase [Bacteroidales bacterium]|nr:histidinol-phosphatase [Bacteroidales bacterium]
MKKTNYHTHSHYCDGKDVPENFVKKALEGGFYALGFSSHAPVPFKNNFAIAEEDLPVYRDEVRSLAEKYKDTLRIFLSLEIDFVTGVTKDFAAFQKELGLDYIIGSVHLVRNSDPHKLWFIDGPKAEIYDEGLNRVFGGDIKKAVKAYYHQINQMLESQPVDVVGHLDKIKMHNKDRYFEQDEKWYRHLVLETLEVIKQTGAITEVNTRGIYKGRSDELFPGNRILKELKQRHMPIMLNSDAHKPDDLTGYMEETRRHLQDLGFKELMVFDGEWKAEAL